MIGRGWIAAMTRAAWGVAIAWSTVVAAGTAQGGWQAGAAAGKITPRVPMWMAGYASRDRPAEGTTSELFCKALVLVDEAGRRGCIVTLDLVAIDRELSGRVCARLAARHGLAREQILICVSHTHSGPVVGRSLAAMTESLLDDTQRRLVDEYAETLEATIEEVVGRALSDLGPAELSHGSGRALFAVNRRANPEARVPELRAAGRLAGPTDHDVPVLAVRRPGGPLAAVLFGYACHATVLSFQEWCADYPGFAQATLEASHPGAVALFWAGCGADQNPLPRRSVELARDYGRQLADAVDAVLAGPDMRPVAPRLATTFTEIPLAFAAIPTAGELAAAAASSDRFVAARARLLSRRIAETGRALDREIPYPVATWALGDDVRLVALGGEVVVDYALRLKWELRGGQTWVAAYANDVMAYIPSRRVLVEGGYEGGGAMIYYGQPSPWADDVESRIVAEVLRQAGD